MITLTLTPAQITTLSMMADDAMDSDGIGIDDRRMYGELAANIFYQTQHQPTQEPTVSEASMTPHPDSLFEIVRGELQMSHEDADRLLTPLICIRVRDMKRRHDQAVKDAWEAGYETAHAEMGAGVDAARTGTAGAGT